MKLYKLGLLLLLISFVFSCANDDNGGIPLSELTIGVITGIDEPDGNLEVVIARNGGIGVAEFSFEVSGTATAGEDYTLPAENTFSVPVNGETILNFPIIDDLEVEGDETFIITIEGVNIEASGSAMTTIRDDDTFPFQNGLLITNEGPFNNGFGTVSFLNNTFTEIENDIFQTVNNDNLGNIVQSLGFNGNDAYIVANVSNRITVVDRFTFVETDRIETGLENPRYFEAINGTGYVSNWGDPLDPSDDYIAIIDLSSNTVTATIPVGEGPERMLYNGDKLYVLLRGGFGQNNSVVVINPDTNSIITEIEVGLVPDSLALSEDGSLWVLSSGGSAFSGNETSGQFDRINTTTDQVMQTFAYTNNEHPSFLNIIGNEVFYYLNSGVFSANALDFTIPPVPDFTTPVLWNMFLPDNRTLIGCNAGDFASNGAIHIYDVLTTEELAAIEVGIIPGNIYINE